jgi:NACalpha-BTF3-like transcription factor
MSLRRPSLAVLALATLGAAPSFAASCPADSYGAGVTLTETTAIAALLEKPAGFVGQTVAIKGQVKDVCEKMGCWLEVVSTEGTHSVKVKVKDGEIVFPKTARGKEAVAQGTFEKQEMTREQFIDQAQHVAQEQGKTFDPATISGDGPFTTYRIQGTGASICK